MSILPLPTPQARLHSQRLTDHLKHAAIQAGGKLSFAQFMELALYTPDLGYYQSGKILFGRKGDFITAPEISPLFGQCINEALTPLLKKHPHILELGAGSGKLAASILQANSHIKNYFILEPSSALQQLQQQTLQQLVPQYFSTIHWLNTLPTQFNGAIIANEVMDALPAVRFYADANQTAEYYVHWHNQDWAWQLQSATPALNQIVRGLNLPPKPYHSEWQPWLKPWIGSLADCLAQGAILLFDYGFPRAEFYHPDRDMGTLMCHYQHYTHDNPLIYVGLQDITVHVDFTAVAEAADEHGLSVAGYTHQAAFLLENNITQKAQDFNDRQQIKMLTLPQEMGELFKAMLLTRGEWPMTGFQLYDQRYRL